MNGSKFILNQILSIKKIRLRINDLLRRPFGLNRISSTKKIQLRINDLLRRPFGLNRILFEKGFSLFEVLIAMAIMASSVILLYVSWSGNHTRIQKMGINNQMAFLLDQIISELEIKYTQRISMLPEKEEGTFKGKPRFSWFMESKKFEMPNLQPLLIASGQGDENLLMMTDQLTQYLNNSIREMKVTVKYTLGKKSVKHSVTTFLVDYDFNPPWGGVGNGAGR